MEWVETTGKSVEEAKEKALDQLGVADEDAEFEVLEEPRAGLFGLMRGEARLRARVRPTEVRPKQDRRRGRRNGGRRADDDAAPGGRRGGDGPGTAGHEPEPTPTSDLAVASGSAVDEPTNGDDAETTGTPHRTAAAVAPEAVGAAATAFMNGLVDAFDMTATVDLAIDGTELEVVVDGSDLGLLIGPGGRTLLAVQDLARVAAQRRLGDHETRLRIDIAGYRERRRAALERFARTVADQVIASGTALALEPMPSADRKVVHDVLASVDGVASHSEGDDPARRVVVTPA